MSYSKARKIIVQQISQATLYAYLVGFDIDSKGNRIYRLDSLVKELIEAIPEFVLGYHLGETIPNGELVSTLRDSAKAIYSINEFKQVRDIYASDSSLLSDIDDKYLKRGEFGELILHLLLRSYHDTIPLLSKIYFKDSFGATVHGFDAVHIQQSTKTLWLGESKLYNDGKSGIIELINDLKKHVVADYLRSEFAIVSRKIKLFDNIPEKEHWINLLDESTKISDVLENINIPLLCTYESSLFSQYDDEKLEAFIDAYRNEIEALWDHFDRNNNHPLRGKLNLILLLFPVKSKKDLVSKLHRNLSHMQSLGEF